MITKGDMLNVIEMCNKFIDEDTEHRNKLDMADRLTAERRHELELKNCGMRNLRNKLINEYNSL